MQERESTAVVMREATSTAVLAVESTEVGLVVSTLLEQTNTVELEASTEQVMNTVMAGGPEHN